MAQQLKVFVSHSSADSAFCHALVRVLRGAGADVWYDKDNLGTGVLRREIMRELANRPDFLVVLSKPAFASEWVQDECEWAYNIYKRKPERLLLPVVGAAYDTDDFDTLLYIESLRRVEAPGHKPYPTDEAIERTLRLLTLTPSGAAPLPTTPQPAESVDDLIAHGKALSAQGEYAEALPFFERATQRDARNADAWFNLGYTNGELGRHDEALAVTVCALDLQPDDAMAWANKGVALGNLGRYQEELAAYDHALALDPDNALAWTNKGVALGDLGRWDEALAACAHALALDPLDAETWNNQAWVLLHLERYDEAAVAIERSLSLDPELAEAWDTKAQLLNRLSRFDEAVMCASRALGIAENGTRWHTKAVALRGLGQVCEAEEAERRMKELGWQEEE